MRTEGPRNVSKDETYQERRNLRYDVALEVVRGRFPLGEHPDCDESRVGISVAEPPGDGADVV